MEAREIGEDGERGFALLGRGDEFAHCADERWQMAEDFGDADDGDFGVVGDDVHARGAHFRRAAHAEDLHVGAFLGVRWRGALPTCRRRLRRRRVEEGWAA